MTANDRFDLDLQDWLQTQAPTTAPASLHDTVIDRARSSRQRPSWLVGLRGGTFGGSRWTLDRPVVRVAYLLVILALVLAIIAAAIAGGAFRRDQLKLGRNGPIAYSVHDFSRRIPFDYRAHLIDADGTHDRVIGQMRCPVFSQDGSVLTFLTGSHSTTELNVAAPDGSRPHVVLTIGEMEYAVSPDGTRIAWIDAIPITSTDGLFTLGLRTELWVTPVSGGPGIRIVQAPITPNESYSLPVWSADGHRIAFERDLSNPDNGSIYRSSIDVVDEDGLHLHTLTTRPGSDYGGMSWSPDGRTIAFVGIRDDSPRPSSSAGNGSADSVIPLVDIFTINADGSDERNLTNTTAAEYGPEWSPDGTHLAYDTDEGGGHLAIVRMDGPVAVGPPALGPSSSFAWSPDGTKVLLVESVATDPSVDPSVNPQSVRTIIQSVDAAFPQAPTTLVSVDYDIACTSWQRIAP